MRHPVSPTFSFVVSLQSVTYILSQKMATFRFELDHKPTRNKTYNLYLMVTAAGKRTKKKTGIQLKRIDDFNPQCKGQQLDSCECSRRQSSQ